MNLFTPTSPELFFSKNDPKDIRLGDLFKSQTDSIPDKSICLVGYPDDEGIELNGGRIGASKAPDKIRQYLYKMTPIKIVDKLADVGNLDVSGKNLSEKHETAKSYSLKLFANGNKIVSLGGGHDYAYSDVAGFLTAHKNSPQKPVVLNFDAHLDVRSTEKGLNSGTPFFRLLNEYTDQFDFAEIGIQPQCNSPHHREWAISKKAKIFNLNEIHRDGLLNLLHNPFFSRLNKNTPIFLSFDMDCLSSTEAPGCSQSWVTGLKTQDFLSFMNTLVKQSNVAGLGIYETSPPLDLQDQTSKTAALIVYNYIFGEHI